MSQLKKYKRLKYLGKGSYGAAILVELRSNPSQRFVIKEIVIGHLKPAERNAAKSEAEVLHQMNHSNITMYIESFVENEKLYIVMENADGGDLSTAIQNRKKDGKYWDEEEVMRIFVQICLALQHVHNQNILHRDLKSQNIFLTLKGVVKLGDFGIAKVLDATDDQARTQIGTPYYLSPEICESKPYGRESDVWSLGVLLYEIIALEMPFQATSLPALVHRICVAEPNYSVVEKRYSAGLIELTKSMLMKDPQKRPSVTQIVKSEFIKTHISRLLSYTLRLGNAGVEMPLLARPKSLAKLDAHEAEKVIESVHSQQREAESKEVRNQSNREAARIAEREKLRKFRNDMQQQRARGDAKNDDGKEDEGRVVYKPAPSRAVGAGGRDLSPKSARNVSPMSGRNLSPKGGRPVSPMGRNNSPKANRPISPTPRVARPVSPTPKVSRPISPTPKVSRPLSPTPKVNRNMSPVNPRAGGGAHHSHHHHNNHNYNPNYNSHNPERALTPRGAAALRDKERKLAAAAAMKQGYSEMSAQSQYAQRDNNAAAGALQRQPSQREDSARGNHQGGYGFPSQQQIQQQQYNQQQAAVSKANNANEYDSVARREFFANRAAAQAVKAKIEAYDRHGSGGGDRLLMGGGGGNAGCAPARYSQQQQQPPPQQQYVSHPSSRRGSEADQSYAQQAGAHFEDDSYSAASRASRQSYDGDEYSRMDPETRIAHIKAQKEKERQRENAEKEMQIKQAIEANRDARRSFQNAKSAVAFDIDLGGNAGPSMAKAPPLIIARNASRQSLDDKPSASPLADNSPKSVHSEAPARLVRANVREDKGSYTPVESDSGKGRSKKSWGPPVAAKDIAKGITRYSEYSTPTSQMFAPPGERDRSESVSSSNITDSSAVDMNKGAYFDDEAAVDAGPNGAHRREMSRDSIDAAALVGDEDEVVLRRLESKRNSQMQQRQQAKEMFKKLREKRRQQSEGKAGRAGTGAVDAKSSAVHHSVVSPIKRPNPDEVTGLPRAANASPMQLRLMEVMSQVDLAQESVQKAIIGSESSTRGRGVSNADGASGRSRTNSESKAEGTSSSQANTPQRGIPSRKETSQQQQQAVDGRFPHIAEEEDELASTLENWLTEQKRGVTTRRKHGHPLDRDDEAPTPIEEDCLDGYTTQSRYDRDSQAKGSSPNEEVRDEKLDYYISGSLDDNMYDNETTGETASEQSTQKMVRGKYMGNDVEVVGLQCMLAQALMGDGDED